MKERFNCPENKGTQLVIDNEDDEFKLISIMTPWENNLRQEWVVCLSGDDLQRFKDTVAAL